MNEFEFRKQLFNWKIVEKNSMIPTSAEILLYGQHIKKKVISEKHQHLVYAHIKPLEISDELYKHLSETVKLTDDKILIMVQKTYLQYLKNTRKQILSLQREWNRNYAQFRANKVIRNLEYKDIYAICDLVHERIVPIELILKIVFDISSKYGDHRRIKEKEEIFMDPRVLETWNYIKEHASRTIVGPQPTLNH